MSREPLNEKRFASALSRPIFNKSKDKFSGHTVNDSRFAVAVDDDRFNQSGGIVDKYGRKRNSKKNAVTSARSIGKGCTPSEGGTSNSENDNFESRLDYLTRLSRGEISSDAVETSSTGDNSSDGDSDSDSDAGPTPKAVIKTTSGKNLENSKKQSTVHDSYIFPRQSGVLSVVGDSNSAVDVNITEEDYNTARLAIRNCDWENVSAIDLMVVLQSFCSGVLSSAGAIMSVSDSIRSVTIYLSDFGKKRLAYEAEHGPSHSIWQREKESEDSVEELGSEEEEDENDDDDNDDGTGGDGDVDGSNSWGDFRRRKDEVGIVFDEELAGNNIKQQANKTFRRDSSNGAQVDTVALRRYELEKLRYYFAIVICESKAVANTLYEQLDQVEFEGSSMILDLSFVPADVTFEGREVKDFCDVQMAARKLASSSKASGYQPPDFVVNALQHTNVQCSWDEGDNKREKLLTNFSKWRELNESELQQYVASSDSSSDSEAAVGPDESRSDAGGDPGPLAASSIRSKEKAARTRALLLGCASDSEADGANGDDAFFGEGGDDFDEVDEVDPCLADSAASDGLSIAYIPELERSAVQSRQASLRALDEETPFEADQRKRRERRQHKKKGSQDSTGETVARPHPELQGEVPALGRARKRKQRRQSGDSLGMEDVVAAVGHEAGDGARAGSAANGYGVDLTDTRFQALFQGDSRFGIDKTAVEYKHSEGLQTILSEQAKHRRKKRLQGSTSGRDLDSSGCKQSSHTAPSDLSMDKGNDLAFNLAAKLKRNIR